MARLSGLPGTKKDVEAEFVSSSAAAIRHLQAGGAATMAGAHGAINVWIDDDGNYRCQMYRFCITISAEIYGTLGKVKIWLKEWAPEIK